MRANRSAAARPMPLAAPVITATRPGCNAGCPLMVRYLSVRDEIQGDAVDAIALMGGGRAVREDVAEMAAAGRAMHLRADHAMAAVSRRLNRTLDRVVEARPAGAA